MIERHDYISLLSDKQRLDYNAVSDHYQQKQSSQLKLIITGQGGSGKSYVINALKGLLKEEFVVTSYFEIVLFSVGGVTFHSLLELPINGKNTFALKGIALS